MEGTKKPTAYYFQLHSMGQKAEILVLSYHRFLEMNFLPSEVLPAKLLAHSGICIPEKAINLGGKKDLSLAFN